MRWQDSMIEHGAEYSLACPVCGLPSRVTPWVEPDRRETTYRVTCRKCKNFQFTVTEGRWYLPLWKEEQERPNTVSPLIPLVSYYTAFSRDAEKDESGRAVLSEDVLERIEAQGMPTVGMRVRDAMLYLYRRCREESAYSIECCVDDFINESRNTNKGGRYQWYCFDNPESSYLWDLITLLRASSVEDFEYFILDVLQHELKYITYEGSKLKITPAGLRYAEEGESADSKDVFVALWIDDYTALLGQAIRDVLKECEYDPFFVNDIYKGKPATTERQKELAKNETIDYHMIAGLRRAKFIIADLTCLPEVKIPYTNEKGEKKERDVVCAGAYFEAGFASGLGKTVIYSVHKKQKPHFDVNHIHYIDWDENSLDDDFKRRLKDEINARIIKESEKAL